MRLTRLNHENLAATSRKNWCNVDIAVVFHLPHDITVDEEWLFILQLLLEEDAPVFEDLCLLLLQNFIDHVEMICGALLKAIDWLLIIEGVIRLEILENDTWVQLLLLGLRVLQEIE